MKRISALLLSASLLFGPAACGIGSSADNAKNEPREAVDPADAKVGICIYRYDDNFMTLYRQEMERYLQQKGFNPENITFYDSQNSQSVQDDQIGKLIKSDVDVLIINPVDASSADRITDKVRSAGIPLVYINREPSPEEQKRWEKKNWDVTYIGADSRQSGTMQGEIIAELAEKNGFNTIDMNGNGAIDYVMIEGDFANIDARNRTEESIKALTDRGYQVRCLMDEVGNWQTEEGKRITANALGTLGKDVEVVFCNNDAMALGAITSIESAGRVVGKDIYLVGVDALKEAVEAIMEERMTGTVLNDYQAQSHAAVDAAVNYLAGNENEHYIGCDYIKVSQDNA